MRSWKQFLNGVWDLRRVAVASLPLRSLLKDGISLLWHWGSLGLVLWLGLAQLLWMGAHF